MFLLSLAGTCSCCGSVSLCQHSWETSSLLARPVHRGLWNSPTSWVQIEAGRILSQLLCQFCGLCAPGWSCPRESPEPKWQSPLSPGVRALPGDKLSPGRNGAQRSSLAGLLQNKTLCIYMLFESRVSLFGKSWILTLEHTI